jgi:hypothetical protein
MASRSRMNWSVRPWLELDIWMTTYLIEVI